MSVGARTPSYWPILAVFALLLVARVLGIISVYFFEEDEVSLAIGAAALVTETAGGLYRYTVQLGYYRLVEVVDILLGSRVDLIPAIMKGLSAVAGAAIPIAGYFAFESELTPRERWLSVFVLGVNPVIWRSSQYGNTAIVATALATVALVLLSNRPAALGRSAALALFTLALLVRADTVLMTPLLAALLVRSSGSWRRAAPWIGGFGLFVALVYAALFVVDTRIDSALRSVSTHMSSSRPTLFWEYLLWAMSPFLLMFAISGTRTLLERRGPFLWLLLLWCVPTLVFYFRATTTTRYFLNVAVPLSLAAAVGMADLVRRLETSLRPAVAWSLTIGAASIHLFLALGHVPPDRPLEMLYRGTFNTDDGPMPTGAFLARTFAAEGSLLRSLPRPTFGERSTPFWEGPSLRRALAILSDPAAPARTVIVLLSGAGFVHAFHYHMHEAGARVIAGPPAGTLLWEGELWMQLGHTRTMTIAEWTDDYLALPRFDVQAGDQVWILARLPFPNPVALAKVPPELALRRGRSFDDRFQVFDVVRR